MSWQFFERLRLFQEESKIHKQELSERTLKELKDSLEKKLAGQHKLSKQEELVYDALKGGSFFYYFLAVLSPKLICLVFILNVVSQGKNKSIIFVRWYAIMLCSFLITSS